MTDYRLGIGGLRGPARAGLIDLAHEPDFRIRGTTIHPAHCEVAFGGTRIRLQRRVMQVLVALIRAEGDVVSRDELLQRCWAGVVVGDDSINRCIQRLRRLAETEAPGAFAIETLPRVGYRLTAPELVATIAAETRRPLPVYTDEPLRAAAEPVAPVSAPSLPAVPDRVALPRWLWIGAGAGAAAAFTAAYILLKPVPAEAPPPIYSIAVLPVRNLTGDASLAPAVEKLTEDVAQVLGRSRFVYVAPRTAASEMARRSAETDTLGKTLHVRQVLDASLRRSDDGFRVSYQLVDTASGQVIDSQNIGVSASGGVPEEPLAMALYENIMGDLHRRWTEVELARAPDDRDPENVFARLERAEASQSRESVAEAGRLTRIGLVVMPKSHPLRSAFDDSICSYYATLIEHRLYLSAAQHDAWAKIALDAGEEARQLKPHSASPHGCLAQLFGAMGQWDRGLAEANYIIRTFPLTIVGYEVRERLNFERADFRDALGDLTRVVQTSGAACAGDYADQGGCHGELGLVHLFLREDEAAAAEFREAAVEEPNSPFPPFFLAAALARMGTQDAAFNSASVYRKLRTDDSDWYVLAISDAPAFQVEARAIRGALRTVGLSEPRASR